MFREQLILKALAALQEIADECGEKPARPNLSLRFLLAYTFVAAGGRSSIKWIWTDFWRHATAGQRTAKHERTMDDYIRGTGARSALTGICREIGYPTDHDFFTMLRRQGQGLARLRRKPEATDSRLHHANDEPSDNDAA